MGKPTKEEPTTEVEPEDEPQTIFGRPFDNGEQHNCLGCKHFVDKKHLIPRLQALMAGATFCDAYGNYFSADEEHEDAPFDITAGKCPKYAADKKRFERYKGKAGTNPLTARRKPRAASSATPAKPSKSKPGAKANGGSIRSSKDSKDEPVESGKAKAPAKKSAGSVGRGTKPKKAKAAKSVQGKSAAKGNGDTGGDSGKPSVPETVPPTADATSPEATPEAGS